MLVLGLKYQKGCHPLFNVKVLLLIYLLVYLLRKKGLGYKLFWVFLR